jgi:hypothetical protein
VNGVKSKWWGESRINDRDDRRRGEGSDEERV